MKNRELPVTSLFERELTSAVDAVLLLAVPRTSPNPSTKGGAKVSVCDLLVRSCAVALHMHPTANASWVVDEILRHRVLVRRATHERPGRRADLTTRIRERGFRRGG